MIGKTRVHRRVEKWFRPVWWVIWSIEMVYDDAGVMN